MVSGAHRVKRFRSASNFLRTFYLVQNIARALIRDHGMPESQAIATAINALRAFAAGRAFGGRVKTTPEVRAAARRALAEWERLKRTHH